MKVLNKVISGVVIGGILFSTSTIALADTTTSTSGNNGSSSRPPIAGKMMRGGDMGKGAFGKDMAQNIESDLKTLVSAGVLTQDESDKILALSKQEGQARQAEADKVKNMTDSERKAYFESKKGTEPDKKGGIFAQAAANGIITREKADAANAKLDEARDADRAAKVTEGLNGLVTAGTITKDQAAKVTEFINTMEANKPAPGTAPVKPKDPSNATTGERKNPMSALVDNGTLTQAQFDAVMKAISIGGRGHGGPGRHDGAPADKAAGTAAGTTSSTVTQ